MTFLGLRGFFSLVGKSSSAMTVSASTWRAALSLVDKIPNVVRDRVSSLSDLSVDLSGNGLPILGTPFTQDGYSICPSWVDEYPSWVDEYPSWVDEYPSWVDGGLQKSLRR